MNDMGSPPDITPGSPLEHGGRSRHDMGSPPTSRMIRQAGEPSGLPSDVLSMDRLLPERAREAPWLHGADSISLDHDGPTNDFVPFEDGWVERPVVERFEDVVRRYGDKIAVDDSVMRLTYREVRRASLRL